jgi:hypothetical protein
MPSRAQGPTDRWRIVVTDDYPTKLYTLTETLRNAGRRP